MEPVKKYNSDHVNTYAHIDTTYVRTSRQSGQGKNVKVPLSNILQKNLHEQDNTDIKTIFSSLQKQVLLARATRSIRKQTARLLPTGPPLTSSLTVQQDTHPPSPPYV